ncbi:MAG: hypothetical protein H6832_18615 [Planctomycetes bacterium]|nr:hypothetical protein [Planctomycetota bacterium]MCB9920422.1 hypothetical protein [Planctomycetota bacterium]
MNAVYTTPARASITISATETGAVEIGKRFSLTVTVEYPTTHRAPEFDGSVLAPLRAKLRSRDRERTATSIRETTIWSVWLVDLPEEGTLVVEPVTLRAEPVDGGEVLLATSEALRLDVRPLASEGPAELPSLPTLQTSNLRAWVMTGTGLVIGAVGFVLWRRQRLAKATRPEDPDVLARRILEGLNANLERDGSSDRSRTDAPVLSRTLRDAVHRHLGIDAVHEPIDMAFDGVHEDLASHDLIGRCRAILARVDAIKFASAPMPRDDWRALVADAHDIHEAILRLGPPERTDR